MKKRLITRLVLLLLVCLLGSTFSVNYAKEKYPSKPIRMVVGFSPGGATDIIARVVAQKLSERLGQSVVVENKDGATGIIGTQMVAEAPADGYTLLMVTAGTHAINASLYKKLPYDPVKSFTHVCYVATAPNVLVVNSSSPIKSVKDLIEAAKAKPGELTFGSAGTGSTLHLAGELFKSMTGINIVHVPYKGGAPAMTDLLGGRLTMMFDSISQAMPHITAGKLRALGVTGTTRVKALPDVPTIAEAGVKGYSAAAWFGVVAPAGLPKSVTNKLNAEINKVLQLAEVKQRFEELGTEPTGGSPEAWSKHIQVEVEKWAKVIKEAGIPQQ